MISQLLAKCKPFFEFLSKIFADRPCQTKRAARHRLFATPNGSFLTLSDRVNDLDNAGLFTFSAARTLGRIDLRHEVLNNDGLRLAGLDAF